MIAISSPHLSQMPFPEALEMVAGHYKAWEVVAEGEHLLRNIIEDYLILAPSYDLEFSVHAPLSDINIGSLNPTMREAALKEVMECLDLAHRMGASPVTVHPGFISPLAALDREKAVATVQRSLKAIDERAKENGIKVALENMPQMPIAMAKTPDELLRMIEDTDLGICFDIGHANTVGNIETFLNIRDRMINMHVHDNLGDRDRHMVIGEGNIDFSRWLGRFLPYSGRYVIEAREFEQSITSLGRLEGILRAIDQL